MGRLGARGALLAVAVAVLVAAAPAAADDPRAADVPMLVQEYETRHPNLFHGGSRVAFEGAADDLLPRLDRDAFLVELMRLAALAGPREGHQDSASPPAPTPRPSRRSRRAVRAESDQSSALRTLDAAASSTLAYNVVQRSVNDHVPKLLRFARQLKVRRIVVDLRLRHRACGCTSRPATRSSVRVTRSSRTSRWASRGRSSSPVAIMCSPLRSHSRRASQAVP